MIKKEIIDGKLECSKCKTWYPATLEFFFKDKKHTTGLTSHCKKCRREYRKIYNKQTAKKNAIYSKKYRAENPEKARNSTLIRKYGITLEDYKKILKSQNNKCLICLCKFFKYEGNVDHNHETGKIRGILCPTCNKVLGLFNDNIDRFHRALKYLDQ